MTKRDYILIANNIRWAIKSDDSVKTIALNLCNMLEADNPKFDRDKFLQACGIEHVHHFIDGYCECGTPLLTLAD